MKKVIFTAIALMLTGSSVAADLEIEIEIPWQSVSEYHRPYVALWIERPDNVAVATLGVWYRSSDRWAGSGVRWLRDLQYWWRRFGLELKPPPDGITSATPRPGLRRALYKGDVAPLSELKPGNYVLRIEAVRERGGRDLVRIPFRWDAEAEHRTAKGTREIGRVTLKVSHQNE